MIVFNNMLQQQEPQGSLTVKMMEEQMVAMVPLDACRWTKNTLLFSFLYLQDLDEAPLVVSFDFDDELLGLNLQLAATQLLRFCRG